MCYGGGNCSLISCICHFRALETRGAPFFKKHVNVNELSMARSRHKCCPKNKVLYEMELRCGGLCSGMGLLVPKEIKVAYHNLLVPGLLCAATHRTRCVLLCLCILFTSAMCVVARAYSSHCHEAMLKSLSRTHVHDIHFSCLATDVVASDYLRAFQASGEMSERVLAITRLVLEYNPSHYTAWWFRRR